MEEPDRQAWGGGRIVLGFLLAPAIPAVLVGLNMSRGLPGKDLAIPMTLAVLVFGGYLPILTIGLPLFYASRGLKIVRHPLALMIAGALIAMTPTMAMTTWAIAAGEQAGGTASAAAVLAVLGALAGLAFWLIAFWRPSSARGR